MSYNVRINTLVLFHRHVIIGLNSLFAKIATNIILTTIREQKKLAPA
jgi:hypothetical protein